MGSLQFTWTTGNTWPQPYAIDWSGVTDIQNVAQVGDALFRFDLQKEDPVVVE